ncbi:MAG: pyridoxamine 5'-phosphate oxidase family protein [Clostridia bacterium]|nr:pyridoxamine 5'-phosphate oxidase family protein [Clostridia bacterium]
MCVLNDVLEYIEETKYVILATTGKEGPSLRTLGSFANDELEIYFSTDNKTAKVGEINFNPNVSLLFQHEGQQLQNFRNVTLGGQAKRICCGNDRSKAIQILSKRNPRFKERAEKGELDQTAIFKFKPRSLKYLDFTNGIGPDAVREFHL